jgi:hypothetical protein
MPYPNEHSARLQEPDKFDPKTFHRTEGGTIYGSKKVPSSVGIIWGKLKTANKPKDNPIPQALRFPTKNWTADKAKKWLKDNNIECISFEPATEKKEKQKMAKRNSAPVEACLFNITEYPVDFVQDVEKNNFKIIALSGKPIMKHPYWGNLAFDLSGIQFATNPTPILEEHFREVHIGFSTKQEISKQAVVEGRFLSNERAQQIKKDLNEGFPMQASVFLPPSEVQQLRDGESTEVNGYTLKGPGAVFRKGKILEVSMCTLGADSSTNSKAFADGGRHEIDFEVENVKENTMAEEKETTVAEMTAETFAADYPDLLNQIKADAVKEGQKQVKEMFTKFAERFGDDPAFCIEQFRKDANLDDATLEYAKKQKKEKDAAIEAAKNKRLSDPAAQSFSDDQDNIDKNKAKATGEEGWKKEFADSQKLQDEFGDVKFYIAFKRADEKGQVRVKRQA